MTRLRYLLGGLFAPFTLWLLSTADDTTISF